MLSCSTQATLIPFAFNFMFDSYFQSFLPNARGYVNSTAADAIYVDALTGKAVVAYADGSIYRYTNVSRRAIVKFMLDDARSMGKFINKVLKQERTQVSNKVI